MNFLTQINLPVDFTKEYSLDINIYGPVIEGDEFEDGLILYARSDYDYESGVIEAVNDIISVFRKYFGYIVDYTLNSNIEEKRFGLDIYLKLESKEPENPIDPPEEGFEEPVDPPLPNEGEDGEDATDENSHI